MVEQNSGNRDARGTGPDLDPTPFRNLLTVVLEDYYHVAPLKSVVQTEKWYRFERRVARNTHAALDLLDEFNVSATFFVLGSIADEMPELVREVAERGHEIASKGYFHRSIRRFSSPEEFRDDLARSREALERASGSAVRGFRIGHRWFCPEDLWALDVLAAEGFAYDSSVRPLFWRYANKPLQRLPYRHCSKHGEIWEFPLPSATGFGWSLPISGGNYFRQFPHWMMRRVVDSWITAHDVPFLMYFHVWELDPDQPRIRAAPLYERIRQYRNLDKMATIIRDYLERYEFAGIGEYLGLPVDQVVQNEVSQPGWVSSSAMTNPSRTPVQQESGIPISVVVPCYNETLILPYLSNTLQSVENELARKFDLRFIFVDDGSSDDTWSSMKTIFGNQPNSEFLRHQSNQGVAAAIMTGIRAARTDVVCSIDCDCTYDPHQLEFMIPLLTDGVDMVTASPYHSEGVVRNVPGWRLFLSKTLSRLYRLVLHHSLATYTSCFRVYRRSAVTELPVRESGFLGVAEMLGQLDLRGGTIVEYPAVLEVRLLGRSKMKTLRTIAGHFGLLLRLTWQRFGLGSSTPVVASPPFEDESETDAAKPGSGPSQG